MGCTPSKSLLGGIILPKRKREWTFEDKYVLSDKLLGRGSFSVVQHGSYSSFKDKEVAIKIIMKEGTEHGFIFMHS